MVVGSLAMTDPVCCEPCELLRYCRDDRNCCIECHFTYEEALALPYLPRDLQQRIVDEHAALERLGFPERLVILHAKWEEKVFRRYCPADVCELIEQDHEAHGRGQLPARTPAMRALALL